MYHTRVIIILNIPRGGTAGWLREGAEP